MRSARSLRACWSAPRGRRLRWMAPAEDGARRGRLASRLHQEPLRRYTHTIESRPRPVRREGRAARGARPPRDHANDGTVTAGRPARNTKEKKDRNAVPRLQKGVVARRPGRLSLPNHAQARGGGVHTDVGRRRSNRTRASIVLEWCGREGGRRWCWDGSPALRRPPSPPRSRLEGGALLCGAAAAFQNASLTIS